MSTATLRHVAMHPYSGPHGCGAYKAFGSMTSVEKSSLREIFKIFNDAIGLLINGGLLGAPEDVHRNL